MTGLFRSLLLIILLLGKLNIAHSQTPTLQEKLYYTCKVWGFVKYYHSEVSTCHVNWDSVLLHTLPLVESSATNSQFNDALDTMLAAAGTMAISTTYFPDTLAAELKRNRDWSWITSGTLRADVQAQLDTIKNNFRPHASCWVVNNYGAGSFANTGGWLAFPYDSLGLDINTNTSFPDQNHRLLMFFKYWSIIRYFNPYNYALDESIDTTLFNYAHQVYVSPDANELFRLYLNVFAALNDAHTYAFSYSTDLYTPPNGIYRPRLRLKYVSGNYVVIKSEEAGINVGDIVRSIDGLTMPDWEDSLSTLCSAGNSSVLRRIVCERVLLHTYNYPTLVETEDFSGLTHSTTLSCTYYPDTFYTNYFYPNDTLANISWTVMGCDIGYVNMGNIHNSEVPAMYTSLMNKSAIVFDLRNYPNGTAGTIVNLLASGSHPFAKNQIPDINYPGTYKWENEYIGTSSNPTAYGGKIILLVDETTQSQAEYSSMIFRALPNSIIVGSQTAGADGDVSWWKLSQDIHTGFSSIGVFYPNGDSTQRIGIVPDTVVYPTREGVRDHNDVVLNRAIEIACGVSVPDVPQTHLLQVYPNPVDGDLRIVVPTDVAEPIHVSLTDAAGRLVRAYPNLSMDSKGIFHISTSALVSGIYYVIVNAAAGTYRTMIVKK